MNVLDKLKIALKPSPKKAPANQKKPAASPAQQQLQTMTYQQGTQALKPPPEGVGPKPSYPPPKPGLAGVGPKPSYPPPKPTVESIADQTRSNQPSGGASAKDELKTVFQPPEKLAPPPAKPALTGVGPKPSYPPPRPAVESIADQTRSNKPSGGASAKDELKTVFEPTEKLAPPPAKPALTWQGDDVTVGGAAYKKGKELGRGQMGAVHRLDAQAQGADPLVMKTALGDQQQELRHEADVQQRLGAHPNVVQAKGTVEQKGEFGLVQEHVGGGNLDKGLTELKGMLDHGVISYGQYMGAVQYLMKGVLNGFAHLETCGVTHRDIKPDNIMLDDKTLQPKIADFGTSTTPEDVKDPEAGNIEGRGPEGFKGKAGPKSDVFGVGMMMHRIGEGKGFKRPQNEGPYAHFAQVNEIIQFGKDPTNRALQPMSAEEKGARRTAPDKSPAKPGHEKEKLAGKYGAETAYTDFMNKVLGPTPETRLSAAQAKEHPFLKDAALSDEQAQGVLRQMLDARQGTPKAADPNAAPKKAWGTADQHVDKKEKPAALTGVKKPPASKKVAEKAQKEAVTAGAVTPKAAKKALDQRKKVLADVKKGPQAALKHVVTKDRSGPRLEDEE